MRVLLVEPDLPRSWGGNQQFIGLLKIGAYHRAMGDDVEYVKGRRNYQDLSQLPDLVCVSSMFTYQYRPVWDAVKYYKDLLAYWKPEAKVLLGGIYATLCPDHARQSGADEVCIGEYPGAEHCYPDITLLRPRPRFAYCMTSRGCSGSCTFCATHLLYGSGSPRQRPITDVLKEIALQEARGVESIYFGDDDIGHNASQHLIPLLRGIIDQQFHLDFYIYGGMQARHVTPQVAQLFHKARFKKLSFGFESVCPKVLKRMGRTMLGGAPALETAIQNLEDAGFARNDISVYFMIGLPYQKMPDMIATLVYLIDLGVWTSPQRWAPIPGTADYKALHLDNWDYADLRYKDFLVPDQDEFTHADLEAIYKIARFFNMGRQYTNFDFLRPSSRNISAVNEFIHQFREKGSLKKN